MKRFLLVILLCPICAFAQRTLVEESEAIEIAKNSTGQEELVGIIAKLEKGKKLKNEEEQTWKKFIWSNTAHRDVQRRYLTDSFEELKKVQQYIAPYYDAIKALESETAAIQKEVASLSVPKEIVRRASIYASYETPKKFKYNAAVPKEQDAKKIIEKKQDKYIYRDNIALNDSLQDYIRLTFPNGLESFSAIQNKYDSLYNIYKELIPVKYVIYNGIQQKYLDIRKQLSAFSYKDSPNHVYKAKYHGGEITIPYIIENGKRIVSGECVYHWAVKQVDNPTPARAETETGDYTYTMIVDKGKVKDYKVSGYIIYWEPDNKKACQLAKNYAQIKEYERKLPCVIRQKENAYDPSSFWQSYTNGWKRTRYVENGDDMDEVIFDSWAPDVFKDINHANEECIRVYEHRTSAPIFEPVELDLGF